MSRLKRPSPALVVAIMALVAAIVVPAYAALTKKDKKTVKNIANTEITKRAPGLAVASANSANTANSANSAGDTAEVHTPTRLVLNDPNPGDVASLEVDLLVAGPFALEAECAANLGGDPNTDFADVDITGPTGYSVGGVRTNGQHFDARHVDLPGGRPSDCVRQ